MSTHRAIHILAMVSLLAVAVMNIIGTLRPIPGAPVEMRLVPLFGLAIWSWLLWMIWKRPRKWGLGVGIFLFLMIVFQSYLWWLGIHNPKLDAIQTGRSVASFVFLYERPIFIAGMCCILLRIYYPNECPDSTA